MYRLQKEIYRKGFTLLEVLIAVVIFSLVATALYTTFRIGLKAYKTGQDNMDELQQVRFIFEAFSKDVKNVFYITEANYNIEANKRITEFKNRIIREEQEGKESEILPEEENPYNQSISIDLEFTGSDAADLDTVTFVRYTEGSSGNQIPRWGLSRLTWKVEEGKLIRTEKSIFVPERDFEGEVVEEEPERIDILARNVVKFNVKYGYFFMDKWMEAPSWSSSDNRYKNPIPELDPEEEDYDKISKLQSTAPPDDLPTFMRLEITIVDKPEKKSGEDKDEGRPRSFSLLINVPAGEETFFPLVAEDDPLYETIYAGGALGGSSSSSSGRKNQVLSYKDKTDDESEIPDSTQPAEESEIPGNDEAN